MNAISAPPPMAPMSNALGASIPAIIWPLPPDGYWNRETEYYLQVLLASGNPWYRNGTFTISNQSVSSLSIEESAMDRGPLAVLSFSAVSREETQERIREISLLEEGWDGYGAYVASIRACDHASRIVQTLASSFPQLESPEVSPSPNGTVLLSWESKNGEACIELGDETFSAYIRRGEEFIPLGGKYRDSGESQLNLIVECLF